MIKKIKTYIAMAVMVLIPALPILAPVSVSAAPGDLKACNSIAGGVADGATAASSAPAGGTQCQTNGLGTTDTNGIGTVASKIVNIFSVVVGAVAVIMIIYGGFRYITSGGSSERVGGAKNSLIYAIIGLIIVALAQVIVHYVLAQSNSIGS